MCVCIYIYIYIYAGRTGMVAHVHGLHHYESATEKTTVVIFVVAQPVEEISVAGTSRRSQSRTIAAKRSCVPTAPSGTPALPLTMFVLSLSIHIHIYIYVYVFMCVYIYIYIHM